METEVLPAVISGEPSKLSDRDVGIPLYVFRGGPFSPAGNTVVTAAPLDVVVSLYGGGGMKGEAGLEAAFGGGLLSERRNRRLLSRGVGCSQGFPIQERSSTAGCGALDTSRISAGSADLVEPDQLLAAWPGISHS
jgi:hypothetical protein